MNNGGITDRSRLRAAAVAAGVFLVFAVFGAWPAPDSNESGYLPQAKHYWNPDYCPGDPFLAAPPPHRLFCAATGWLTRYLSLEAFAWTGRLIVWGLLAAAWTYLGRSLSLTDRGIVLAAGGYVCLAYTCQIAGEWIVGGFEAKGFAWALVWLGLARFVRRDFYGALACAGLATAWHVLVGGWSLVALVLAARRADWSAGWTTRLATTAVVAIGVGAGLWPALGLNAAVDPAVAAEANRIYVFECAPFHLLPEHVHPLRAAMFALELIVWRRLVLSAVARGDMPQMRLQLVVTAALGIGLAGLVLRTLTWSDANLAARVMRYYWFRLGDGLLPVGTAAAAAAWLGMRQGDIPRRLPTAVAAALAGSILLGIAAYRVAVPTPRSEDQLADPAGWRAACAWIRDNTPTDAVVMVPPETQTFHWRAERTEVVTEKDLPHDAAGLVAWRRRYQVVREAYSQRQAAAGSSAAARNLRQIVKDLGATFIVYDGDELSLPVAFHQPGSYTVYRVEEPEGGAVAAPSR